MRIKRTVPILALFAATIFVAGASPSLANPGWSGRPGRPVLAGAHAPQRFGRRGEHGEHGRLAREGLLYGGGFGAPFYSNVIPSEPVDDSPRYRRDPPFGEGFGLLANSPPPARPRYLERLDPPPTTGRVVELLRPVHRRDKGPRRKALILYGGGTRAE